MGGVEPARDYVLRAMRAGKHVVSAGCWLLSQHGRSWRARASTTCSCAEVAVAGVVPVIRVLQESLAAAHVERIHGIVNGTTNYILTEMARAGMSYEDALAQAQQLGYAEADPVTGRDAAAKMAILARLAFDTPVHLDQVRYEGIEHITPDDIAYAHQPAWAEADRDGRARGRRAQRAGPSRVPLRRPPARLGQRAVQRRHRRIRRDHRDHDVGPGRRRAADRLGGARRRDQRDDPARVDAGDEPAAEIVNDVESAFYLHMEVADRPGVLAQVAELLGMQGGSIKSVERASATTRRS